MNRCKQLYIASALAAGLLVANDVQAAKRTLAHLTTGNGFGFQVYSTQDHKLVQFLERPYRYLRARPGQPKADGIARRNLMFDLYFGIKTSSMSGWLNKPDGDPEVEYLDQTNIIHIKKSLGGVEAESYFFAPFGDDELQNTMVALLKAPAATDGFLLLNFHMGTGEGDTVGAEGESLKPIGGVAGAVSETGPGGGAMVYMPLTQTSHTDCQGAHGKVTAGGDLGDNVTCSGDDVVLAYQQSLKDGWMAVAISFVDDAALADARAKKLEAWGAARPPQQILADALAEFEAWRKPVSDKVALCTDTEKKLWRQSETVLRMGQSREAYTSERKNNGMILASLPPGQWHTGWARDAMYAIVPLARTGHHNEARAAIDFFLNAEPVGKFKSYVNNVDYRISVVRYYGNGEEEADFSGQPSPNVEIDAWGTAMWVIRQYLDASDDTAWLSAPTKLGPNAYESIKTGIADALEKNLEDNGIARADSGIWEVHDDNRRHFAYTTLAAARGFCDMAAIAKRAGKEADVTHYQALAKKVTAGFLASFVDQKGALAGNMEAIQSGNYADGAVAEAFTWNILDDFKGKTANATIDLLNTLKVKSGGYKRNNESKGSYDDNEWILVNFRMMNALRRNGRGDEADAYLAVMYDKAASNFFLFPELYNAVAADGEIGRYWGEIPMVGYGSGAYIMTMMDRSGYVEPNDCGDGVGITLPVILCEEIKTEVPGKKGEGGAGPGTADGPASFEDIGYGKVACLCELPGVGVPAGRGTWPWIAVVSFACLAPRRRFRRQSRVRRQRMG